MLLPFPLFLKGKRTFVVAWRRLKLMDSDRFWCASMIFTRDIHILHMPSYLFSYGEWDRILWFCRRYNSLLM